MLLFSNIFINKFSLSFLILTLGNASLWGYIIYFSIVAMRLYKQKGNIKTANYILMIFSIMSLITSLVSLIQFINYGGYLNTEILFIFIELINIIYLVNILFKKAKMKYITNKLFAIVNILFAIYCIISASFNLITFMYYIGYLLRIPYFYNYYELLKGSKENG